jgi:hypothetical protein
MYIFLVIFLLLLPVALYLAFQALFAKKGREKGIRAVDEAYKRVRERHHLKLGETNKFANRIIAIDREMGVLLLIMYKDGITWEKCLNLEEIGSCDVIKTTDAESGFIQQVTIEIGVHNNYEPISFPFFDEQTDDIRDLGRAVKKAQHWQQRLLQYVLIPSAQNNHTTSLNGRRVGAKGAQWRA